MQNKTAAQSRIALLASMAIFGSIGLVRRYIALPSVTIALGRAWIGALFLFLLLLFKRQKPNLAALRKNLLPILLSGIFLGFNWIVLFEAYNYTSVATATLCYYMAPILLILFSPLFFREHLTPHKLLCVLAALVGIVFVSGVPENGLPNIGEIKGILFGLLGATMYASIVILNKKINGVPGLERTFYQLLISGITMLPYALLTNTVPIPAGNDLILLIVAGVVHTGVAYALYFGSLPALPAQTAALYSYLDPVLAIILSALIIHEPMTFSGGIGAVLILGAAILSEYKGSRQ